MKCDANAHGSEQGRACVKQANPICAHLDSLNCKRFSE